jgi:DNA topoisomerase VI subunit B
MAMPSFKPSVNEAREFLEISSDFGDPKEIIREAISNSFDAGANEIHISVFIDKSSGEDELVVTIRDNGESCDNRCSWQQDI